MLQNRFNELLNGADKVTVNLKRLYTSLPLQEKVELLTIMQNHQVYSISTYLNIDNYSIKIYAQPTLDKVGQRFTEITKENNGDSPIPYLWTVFPTPDEDSVKRHTKVLEALALDSELLISDSKMNVLDNTKCEVEYMYLLNPTAVEKAGLIISKLEEIHLGCERKDLSKDYYLTPFDRTILKAVVFKEVYLNEEPTNVC